MARLSHRQPRHAVALYRVSTAEQGHSGLGLEAQQASVRAFVASQGWTLLAEHGDIASGKDDRRPGFQGSPHPLSAAWGGAGGGPARSDHPARGVRVPAASRAGYPG
jgi:hypothetical protein